MQTYTCSCGARYRVPANSAGKRACCTRCQAEFVLAGTDPIEVAPPPAVASAAAGLDAIAAIDRGGLGASSAVALTASASFWTNVGWTLVFFLDPGNLTTFVIVSLVIGFQHVGLGGRGAFGLTLVIVWTLGIFLSLWLMAFLMNVIRDAAEGKDDLPRCTEFSDALDDMVWPLLQFFGTGVFVSLPAMVLALVEATWRVGIPPWAVALAAGVGLFFWPMSVLCVSIGGLGVFLQPNLLIESVIRTFAIYIVVCLIFEGAMLISGLAWGWGVGLLNVPARFSPPALAALASVLEAYALVVAMRVIGLYYYHYKDRFAWSWG
ncbi:MAG TPA: hypothetical protein VGM03_13190 [Phycisphaerae bacterium]|jgi:hypothetical protein